MKLIILAIAIYATCVAGQLSNNSPVNSGTYGVDISTSVSESEFACLKSEHAVSFVVVRCYESFGAVDSRCASNVANARAAGLSTDLYIFPDTSKDPGTQISELASYVKEHDIKFSTLWLDIEPHAWSSDTAKNTAFIETLGKAADSKFGGWFSGHSIGVYTSSSAWTSITGGTTSESSRRLWYSHWDSNASFSDFRSFGGWSSPHMKQYRGDHTECGVGIDSNWY